MIKTIKTSVSLLSLTLIVSGCVSIPNIDENKVLKNPSVVINNPYRLSNPELKTVLSQNWWKEIDDEQLNQLMEKVLSNNDDMKIALLNIEKSQTNVALARSANIPSVNLDASFQREKFSENGLTPPPYGGNTINFSQVAVNSSYEFDIFGKYDSLIKEQENNVEALKLKRDAIILNLSNQVVKNYAYWQYLQIQKQHLSELNNLETAKLNMVEKKKQLGKAVEQEILNEKNNLKTIEIQQQLNQQNLKLTENNLNILTGSFNPNEFSFDEKILNYTLPQVDAVKADAVSNRPDIAYYLAVINAQSNHLQALKADFYPSFSISGDLGLQKISFANVFSLKNLFWDVGPAIHLPIFDSGKIKGNYKIAGLDKNIFIEQYNGALVKAFYDVDTELNHYKAAQKILGEQKIILKNQENDISYEEKKWKIGTISQLDWNMTQQKNLNNQLSFLDNKWNFFNAQINLINALGGTIKNNSNN